MDNTSLLKKLQSYMGNRSWIIPVSFLFSALSSLTGVLPFLFVWLIIRSLLNSGGESISPDIVTYAWYACAVAMLSVFFYFAALTCSHVAAFRVEGNMRRIAMQKIVNKPLGFFDKNTSGRIRKIIDDDSATTHSFIAHQLPELAGAIILPIVTIVMILTFNWQLGVACLIPLLFAFATMAYMMGGASTAFQQHYMNAQEEMSNEAVEYIRGIPVVKVFQQTIFSFKNFYNSIIRYKDLVKKYTESMEITFSFYVVIVHSFAFFLIPAAILLMGEAKSGTSILIDMLLYLLMTPIISTNVMRSMHIGESFFLANEAVNRLEKLTDTPSLPVSTSPNIPERFDICFNQVEFSYPDTAAKVVNGVSFELPQGKTFALVGPSGGGKTTIATLIPRFWDVVKGSVSIGGVDVRDIPTNTLMNHVSFVFQNSQLLKTTLLENIKYGNPKASLKAVNKAIASAQCQDIVKRLPKGLETKIGIDGTYLSGGEQQRISLARAFLKDAPIIVLDEATAFADPENEHLIQEALVELMRGKTVLMIAHRLTTIQHVDQIMVIKEGKIAEAGSHEALLFSEGIYTHMWHEYMQTIEWTIASEVEHV